MFEKGRPMKLIELSNLTAQPLPRLIAGLAGTCLMAVSMSAQAADPAIDPCSLLSKTEVEQTLGKLKSAPRSGKNDRLLTCDYEFVDDSNGLSVWVYPAEAIERARKEFKDRVAVKGLGEEAFLHRDPRTDYTDLFFKQGNAVVEVSVPTATKGADAKVEALARKALGRLKGA
jgi:hypothetical protein